VHDPFGLGLLAISEEADFFATDLRDLLRSETFSKVVLKPHLTMFGRTCALGHESDLDQTLFRGPRRCALDPQWPWAIWYPLRRFGKFAQLPPEQRRQVLQEHGAIGMAYGRAGLARDIRLACHGLDGNDNDFVIGLSGRDLAPLSKLVEAMRQTQQTSQYLERLGPFFVGRVAWQSTWDGGKGP
jgi:chlorite dismutase